MHTLLSMSATKQLEGDLIPLSDTVLELVYGDIAYVESVLGTRTVTRELLYEYYEGAKLSWFKTSRRYISNAEIFSWVKKHNIRGLDYHAPFNAAMKIWFRNPHDGFIFRLEFGSE